MRLINKLLSIALLAATMLLSACPQERVIIRRVPVATPGDRSLDDRKRTPPRVPIRRPIPTRPRPVVRRPVPPRPTPVHKVCLYEEENFKGRSVCGRPPLTISNSAYVRVGKETQNWSGRVQSIRLIGNARIQVYRAPKLKGGSLTVNNSLPNLREISLVGGKTTNWVGQVESFRIFYKGGRRFSPPPRKPPPSVGSSRICFFENTYYRGRKTCFPMGSNVGNLGSIKMQSNHIRNVDNRFMSLKVYGRSQVRVWANRFFRGRSITLIQDTPDLRSVRTVKNGVVNWGGIISSLKIQRR